MRFTAALVLVVAGVRTGAAQPETEPVVLALNEQLTPRANGLAGGFVALADDFGAALVNPAGLARMPRFIEGTIGYASSAGIGQGASLSQPRGVLQTPTGAAFRHCAYTLGFAWSHPFDAQESALGGGGDLARVELNTWSLFAAWKASPKLSFGLTFNESSLKAESVLGLPEPFVEPNFSQRSQDASNVMLGVAFDPTEQHQFALTYRTREEWVVRARQDLPHALALRVPTRLTFGYAPRITISELFTLAPTGQLEWVDYGGSLSSLGGRAGFEASIPVGGCWSGCGTLVQARAGVSWTTRDALLHLGTLPGELDREAQLGFGGSVTFKTWVPMRVDIAAQQFSGDLRWTAALMVRYGVSFRDVRGH